jgi:hypothetical protein
MQASGRTATAPRQAALPQVSRGKVFQTCATVGQQMRDQFALLQGACVQWSGVCQLHISMYNSSLIAADLRRDARWRPATSAGSAIHLCSLGR